MFPVTITPRALQALARRTLQRGPMRLSEIEEVYIEVAMELSESNVSRAAGLLGFTRAQLDYRLKKMAQGAEG
ncbi:Bacterial regulatory protein, Fis family [compost metagenome]